MDDMRLIHLSNMDTLVARSQEQVEEPFMKPRGLWLSVGDEWEEWCLSENFYKGATKHRHRIKLTKDANVLLIDNAGDLRAFTDKYVSDRHMRLGTSNRMYMRWNEMAQFYGGIIIAPYLWKCRLDDDTFWYYSWDCACGCIWDHRCIDEITYEGVKCFDNVDA